MMNMNAHVARLTDLQQPEHTDDAIYLLDTLPCPAARPPPPLLLLLLLLLPNPRFVSLPHPHLRSIHA